MGTEAFDHPIENINVSEQDNVSKIEHSLPISAQTDLNRIRKIGLKRLQSTASYILLPKPDTTNASNAISVRTCCGIGHRLCYNIPTFVYAAQHSRHMHWTNVSWSVLFNDTDNIKDSDGAVQEELYGNDFPMNWLDNTPKYFKGVMPKPGTPYNSYADCFCDLFGMPLGQSVVQSPHENLSPSVLSFLTSICEQLGFHKKEWRHVNLFLTLNATLYSMELLENKRQARNISVFVASDNPNVRLWLHNHVPLSWNVIQPEKKVPKPASGV
eukprot:CCRYP_012317-RA/>CCRYP_012317-RA protein AED:0.24 eAED:0.24 QI:0/0/0/0.66/0/0/3/0/269